MSTPQGGDAMGRNDEGPQSSFESEIGSPSAIEVPAANTAANLKLNDGQTMIVGSKAVETDVPPAAEVIPPAEKATTVGTEAPPCSIGGSSTSPLVDGRLGLDGCWHLHLPIFLRCAFVVPGLHRFNAD